MIPSSSVALKARLKTKPAPMHWSNSCTNTECSVHQLSPYIGKLKSCIAGDLIESYSKKGDLIVDPFAGAGTIPFEAVLKNRRAFAADISPYSKVLTTAKLNAPKTLEIALIRAEKALLLSQNQPEPDLRKVPAWIRAFFHPLTLKETIKFASVVRDNDNDFLFACLLGILHHQRPGFLSFPSSHLVPYLRDKKFPRSEFPELYEYRPLRTRLLAKIKRTYKRADLPSKKNNSFAQKAVEEIRLPKHFDCVITSPPYMNALDYGRDNRLRLWFIDPQSNVKVDNTVTQRKQAFANAMECLASKIEVGLASGGHCVFVVGESVKSTKSHPANTVLRSFENFAPSLGLEQVLTDKIPDIRRTRKECNGVKTEHILILKKH